MSSRAYHVLHSIQPFIQKMCDGVVYCIHLFLQLHTVIADTCLENLYRSTPLALWVEEEGFMELPEETR
jgi:hypothetical protein